MVVLFISSMCPAATSGRDYVGPYVCIVPFPGHTDVGKQPSERINRRFVHKIRSLGCQL